ncbi:MAG TPA: DNA-binding domain-containing protein [Acetobacteraceae bacterium]|nr:DNA-binding domain-containing protein [Acetobacteraceae bacterium]
MLPLLELQTAFGRCLLDADVAPPAGIVGDAGERLAVYRNTTFLTLTRLLRSVFPVVCRLVDERFFDFAAHSFIRRHPPRARCLSQYGADFADFLAGFAPAASVPCLPDMARLEWAISRVTIAPTAPALDIGQLAAAGSTDPAGLRLTLQPGCAHLASPHPVDRIWQAHQADAAPEPVAPDPCGTWLEIVAGEHLVLRRLAPPAWHFRQRLADGATLGAAAEAALQHDSAFDLAAALATLFAEGLVVGLTG